MRLGEKGENFLQAKISGYMVYWMALVVGVMPHNLPLVGALAPHCFLYLWYDTIIGTLIAR